MSLPQTDPPVPGPGALPGPGSTSGPEGAAARALLDATRLRDPSLAAHGERTAQIAVAIAEAMGLDSAMRDRVFLGAHLHDVGKLGVSEAILWKPAGLTQSEWKAMRSHPEHGHRLVVEIVHRDVASSVLYHHERADGDGYPFGIDGRTLPITVRIVQVADAFDAITSDRPYEPAAPTDDAVVEITRCAGTQFDPEVAHSLGGLFWDGFEAPPLRPVTGVGAPADPFATL